ncbi:MAG: PAS domain S-box protein [Candidatus Cyclobacteriaceae bacterium M2_1C_046]
MKKFRLTIGNRIFAGFLFLIFLFILNAGVIFITGNKIDNIVNKSSEVYRPSKEAINDFILMVTRSKMLVTNWVYLQSNTDDKEALKDLHNVEYPQLKEEITKLMPYWESDSLKAEMDTLFIDFEKMMAVEKDVMDQLVTFEDYEDPLTKLLGEDAIESQIIPMTTSLINRLNDIAEQQQAINVAADEELMESTTQLRNVTLILGIIIILIGLLGAYLLVRSITKPIKYVKEVIVKLGKGELVEDKEAKFSNDEIGEMAVAVDNLVNGLKSTTNFAENIGKGKYDSDFKPLSDSDVLGNALIEMRNNLARVADEDKKRNWSTEGLAKFGEILRGNNDNMDKLSDEIIRNLVKYLRANQGGLYIISDEEDNKPFMSLKSVYAWDKKKYIDQKIYKGEGLAGQVWQESDTVYLTDVPDNYIKITSGLGDANPSSILIVPLKVNEEIMGVVEIASFNLFEDYEIEFVEKIAESIASTISSVKISAKTQRLLEESQEMTEQMRSQEEEMRQNMEELQATQEEMQRSQSEAENTMDAVQTALATVEFDNEGRINNINNNFLDLLNYSREELLGEHHRIFVTKEEKQSDTYKQFWRDLSNGISKKGDFKLVNKKGKSVWVKASYAPVKGRNGEVIKIMGFIMDITAYKKDTPEEEPAPAV